MINDETYIHLNERTYQRGFPHSHAEISMNLNEICVSFAFFCSLVFTHDKDLLVFSYACELLKFFICDYLSIIFVGMKKEIWKIDKHLTK